MPNNRTTINADLRKAAKGKECTVRLPVACNYDVSTTVLAHIALAGNSGVGMKPCDLSAVRACSGCHDVIDGRVPTHLSRADIEGYVLRGMCRTHDAYRKEGLI